MQYVFLIRSSAGCKKYITRRMQSSDAFLATSARAYQNTYCMGKRPFLFLLLIYMWLLTIFYAKKHGTLLYCRRIVWHYDSERVCRWGVFLNSVRPMGSTPFNTFLSYYARSLMAFVYIFVECTLPRQSSIANRVLHKHQRNWSSRDDFSDHLYQNDTNGRR